jgi:hypothetical protein
MIPRKSKQPRAANRSAIQRAQRLQAERAREAAVVSAIGRHARTISKLLKAA